MDEADGREAFIRRTFEMLPWFVSPTGSTLLVITTACWFRYLVVGTARPGGLEDPQGLVAGAVA